MDKDHKKFMEEYYADNHLFLKLFWMNKKNLAMHMGFWEKDTKNLHEALMNENKAVIKALDIKKDEVVLDAGCGLGGTAMLIANGLKARVKGIDIVDKNIQKAKIYARKRQVSDLVDFMVDDFTMLQFKKETFDKIYALESLACIQNKKLVIKELSRVLKGGGKIAIADYFVSKKNLSSEEEELVKKWSYTWSMSNLLTADDFVDIFKKEGFSKVKFIDTTEKVLPSIKKISKISLRVYPLLKIASFLKMTKVIPDYDILLKEMYMFEKGLIKHGILVAEKS